MTHKLTVRFGGAADSEVHDYSDRVRLYNSDGSRSIHGGMRCDNGSASSGEFELLDEQNQIPHGDAEGLQLAAHNQVIWSEDSPGYDAWLSIGRVSPKNVERPYDRTAGVARTWVTQFDDANMDIDGITLTADEARPAETDVDRMLWALGAFCDGDPRLTTVFGTHLVSSAGAVTMPAKTYEAGTELDEIFQDCASTAGKMYAVVIHEDSGADHTCFLYIDEEDHTTYTCTLSISDQLADVDGETVFEPHWRQGAATTEDGQDLQTGIVSRYGMDTTATVVVTDSTHADAYDYWVKPYFDDVSATATQATNRATALLHARWTEHLTHTPSILIPARLHNLVRAGMSIDIRSAAAMGGQYLGTTQTRRIAQIEWEPAGRRGDDELLWANLQLDRPRRVLGAGSGNKGGGVNTPKPPTEGTPGTATTYEHYTWDGTGNNPTANEEEPKNHEGTLSGTTDDWYSVVGGGIIVTPGLNGTSYKHGVNHDDGQGCAIAAGTRFTWSWWWSAFNDPVYFYITYYDSSPTPAVIAGPTLVATGSGGDALLTFTDTVPAGATQMLLKGWTGPGPSGVQATYYVDEGLIQTITDGTDGDTPPSLGGPSEGTFGDCDSNYLPSCAVIEHGDLSGKGGIMHDASQISITDAGGHYDSGNVEGALQEAAGNLVDVVHAERDAYLATAFKNDDESLYVLVSDDGKTWTELYGDVFNPGTEFVRDPSLMIREGTWWVCHTRGPAGGAFGTTDSFGVASSPDGKTWTAVADVSLTAITGIDRAWAPQWFVDEDGTVHVFIAVSTDTGTSFTIYETHPTNAAMTTWSSPVDVGIGTNYIDPFIVRKGGFYYLWAKNETTKYIEVFRSTSLTSGYSSWQTGDWAGWGSALEGESLVRVDARTWRIYLDAYNDEVIYYSESIDDWATWSTKAAVSGPYYMQHPDVHYADAYVEPQLRWEPVTFDPGTGPEIVFTTTDIVMTWKEY